MSEKHSGLRFDIYERIYLADNSVDIKELEEVELVPHIQVYTEQNEAVLKGNLYLTGKYVGDVPDGESRTLEHFIPVEITLPIERVHNMSEVSAEIENFDVEVLSPRSVNVTGVLTLHGIEWMQKVEDWLGEEEAFFEYEVVPLARHKEQGDESFPTSQPVSKSLDPEPVQVGATSNQRPAGQRPFEEELDEETEPAEWTVYQQGDSTFEEAIPAMGEETTIDEANAPKEPAQPEADATNSNPEPAEAVQEANEAEDDKPADVKIAFGTKPEREGPYHLQSLLNKSKTDPPADRSAREITKEEPPIPESKADMVEWTKLFVRSQDERDSFKRVRIYIVQKEDSLESIAEKYNLHPRELLLHNKLERQEVSEGTLLVIPR